MPPAATDYEIVGRYNSSRNPDNVYEVYRFADGELRCSCPGCRFSKEKPKTCRHIKRVIAGLDDDTVIAERAARIAKLDAVLAASRVTLRPAGDSPASYRYMTWIGDGETLAKQRLLDALDESGLFAPRASRPEVVRSRGARVITLDED